MRLFNGMFRFALRLTGLVLLAVAFALFVADATRSIAGSTLSFSSLEVFLDWISPAFLASVETLLNGLHPLLWDPVATALLQTPAFLPLSLAAILCLVLGARRGD